MNDRNAIHTKQAAYRTYVIGVSVPIGSVTKALYGDTSDPYHYVRLQNAGDHDVLIVGGEDHKTGQADDTDNRFNRLEAWTRARFPMSGAVVYRWSGQVMEPIDSLAFIGRNPGGYEYLYRHGRFGERYDSRHDRGMLLTDVIQGRHNEWAPLYDPARITLRAATEFMKENLNVAAQFRDYASGGEVTDAQQIKPGTGAIIRDGIKKLAVYRNLEGKVQTFNVL